MIPAAGAWRRRGFTLTELTVLLVILGIIGAAVVPAIRVPSPEPLALGAAEIGRMFLAARDAALHAGVPVRLTLDPRSLQYLIEEAGDSSAHPVAQGTLGLPGDVTLLEGRRRIRVWFGRNGSTAPDSVTLRSPEGSRVVRLDPWSGGSGTP